MSNSLTTEQKSENDGRGSTIASLNEAAREEASHWDTDPENDIAAELSQSLHELAEIVRKRAERASEATLEVVHENPWSALAIAGAMGAILGLAIAPRRAKRHSPEWRQYLPSPQVAASYIPTEVPTAKSLGRRFESVLEAISEIDPRSVGVPALKSARELISSVRSAVDSFAK